MLSQQIIDQIRTNLVTALDPLEIYIFGSQVWGKTHRYSDVDVFVVVNKPYETIANKKMYAKGHMALDAVDMPSDLILMPQKEFAQKAKLSHTLPYKVKKEGMKIYGRL